MNTDARNTLASIQENILELTNYASNGGNEEMALDLAADVEGLREIERQLYDFGTRIRSVLRAESSDKPDPDGMNEGRARWADAAISAFMATTGTDKPDALSDLLCDLMHWADRNDADFGSELLRAEMHHEAETTDGG